jgi:O-methyltransferase
MTRNKLVAAVVGLMQATQIPISIFPFWYRNIRSNRDHYRPFYQPWREDAVFRRVWQEVKDDTTSLEETAYILFSLSRLAVPRGGEIWECGVYKGATAKLLAEARNPSGANQQEGQTLRLFDTFSGVPERRPALDGYKLGSLGDTSLDRVQARLRDYRNIDFRPGLIPSTFAGLEKSTIAFAHIDVVQFETTRTCCEFIFPRLRPGGIIVFDDYGRPKTIGSRLAVDEYFGALNLKPVVLNTGQAIIIGQ